jgi:hypothetical protein
MAIVKWQGSLSARTAVIAPSQARMQIPIRIANVTVVRPLNPAQVFVPDTTTNLVPKNPIWHFVVNKFSSSGNLELAPNEDPKVVACNWVKSKLPAGTVTTIEAWYAGEGFWKKAFSFVTDAGFWQKDCATWAATSNLSSGHLGQTPPQNWTGVPMPPGWELTGMPWPPNGQFPATPPPGWDLTGQPWPPPPPPGWPATLPWPLPIPPVPTTPAPLPPPAQTLPPPPAPKPSSSSEGSAVGPIVVVVLALAAAAFFLSR